ncbi:hypothetical protein SNOG_13416 [Parastagonospora nodorum SN15]|uniref:Required for respiratory growth protein 7, mitochondrial n=1 Tax=Phaeosphaeria nodorum (strain SN15 / ATCC MYA-4574 / FGSC 10173) TaxID=321614 RepID=Q0U498_PHANO|nr:hypothetical protein SNOG_13416 [Parastagonospora nodorum SN15]EAT79300.1 hypothetical protein SNOG_13416 [Parastagonospora nodorum SN15]
MRPSLRPPWPIKTQLLRWHPRAPQSIPRRIATTSAANAAPIDIPSLILSPGSKHHNSLSSYVAYAKQRKLGPDSPIYVGTHYEYTVALSLLRLGFSLLRVGAKSDAGIDLIGHWVLAPLHEPLRVIIQCKARTMSVSPCHLRDLEGSFPGVPPSWRNQDVLGLLITTQKATKGTLKALGESRRPMGFIMISHDGRIQQIRLEPRRRRARTGRRTHKDIQLTWLGTPIFPERESLDADTLALMRQIHPKPPFQYYQRVETRLSSTKIDAALRDPEPRGGMVDPESAEKVTKLAMPESSEKKPRGRGRPIGRKNKPKVKPRGRGRPKGSKNKPKGDAEAG